MIQREQFTDIQNHLSKKEISIIVGPRQSGKTTIMEMLKAFLDQKNERTLYLNLDIETDRPFFNSHAALIGKLKLELGMNKSYVFIDEIQRKQNAGLFLKGLFDMKLPYKFIASGSGSLELKEKIHESLAGRKRLFELTTITFKEFVNHQTNYRYKDALPAFFETEKEKSKTLLMEYLNFGGYPQVILETELIEKTRIIDELYNSVLEKDIAFLLNVEKSQAFNDLIKTLADQIGSLINYSELSSTLNVSRQTILKYLWFAQKVFLLDLVSPFTKNVRKEISKSPVPYFWDLGLRNYSLDVFGRLNKPFECGFVFQNFVYNILKNRIRFQPTKINFWRTKDKAEVDFILAGGKKIIPIEVKFKSFKKATTPRALRSFINKYNPQYAYIVNLDFKKTINIGKTKLSFIPYYELIFIDL